MENQHNVFELALQQADTKLALIDTEHDTLQSALKKLLTEKTILLGTRRALLIQLGEIAPEDNSTAQTTHSPTTKPFKGMGQARAARKYLSEIGRPQTHAEVVEALLKGHLKIASKHPGNSIRSSMQKHPEWFRWAKLNGDRGQWELVEWPQQVQQPADTSPEDTTVAALSLVGSKNPENSY
jgi:hypothetical protein